MQQLYVAELNDNGIEVLHEVSQEELDELKTSYPNFKAFHRMTELKDIVVENGMDFKEWMQKDNIEKCYFNHIPTEKLVQTSNKLAFNFGASVGTFLYTEEKLLKKYKPGMEIELEKLERSFYDDNIEYRFWVRFRNYVVHYALPYTGLEADGANGIQIVCKKKHLLEFEQWNQVRNDIENMDENVNLPIMVEKMNVLIDALYIHFYTYFAEEIGSATIKFGEFCKKHGTQTPVIVKAEDLWKKEGICVQPLPRKELVQALEILKANPNIKMDFVEI
jgi:hypothetical protein